MKKKVLNLLRQDAGSSKKDFRELKRIYTRLSWQKKTELIKELKEVNNWKENLC